MNELVNHLNYVKFHLGCGHRYFGPDWIHVDADTSYNHVKSTDIYLEGAHPNSADIIYASHLIAYIPQDKINLALWNWLRVLRPGGILRLATPDIEKLAELYAFKKIGIQQLIGPVLGIMEITHDNQKKTLHHRNMFDRSSLTKKLLQSGYVDVKEWKWQEVDHGKFDDHSQAYIPHMEKKKGILISLNIQATKP